MTNRVNILGVGLSVLNLQTALAAIAQRYGEGHVWTPDHTPLEDAFIVLMKREKTS